MFATFAKLDSREDSSKPNFIHGELATCFGSWPMSNFVARRNLRRTIRAGNENCVDAMQTVKMLLCPICHVVKVIRFIRNSILESSCQLI